MTIPPYNPRNPLPFNIPADSQADLLGNFQALDSYFGVDHVPFGNSIESATSANPCAIKSTNHGLTSGNTVFIDALKGLLFGVESLWTINGNSYTATVVDGDNFTINVNTTAQNPYIANSGCFSCATLPYGYHKKVSLLAPLPSDPGLTSPQTSVYTKFLNAKDTEPELFFQNGTTAALVKSLSRQTIVQTSAGRGVKTPWGIILNFGQVPCTGVLATDTFSFPIPFTSTPTTLIATAYEINPPVPPRKRSLVLGSVLSATQFTLTAVAKGPVFYFSMGV